MNNPANPANPSPNLTAKYRPSLSGHNIVTLVSVLRTVQQATNTHEIASCLRVLAPFLAKVEAGAITASHIPSPNSTLALSALSDANLVQQLTGLEVEAENTPSVSQLVAELNNPTSELKGKAEARWEEAYNTLVSLPATSDINTLPTSTLVDAIEHAYLTIELPKPITDIIEGPSSSKPASLIEVATYLYNTYPSTS